MTESTECNYMPFDNEIRNELIAYNVQCQNNEAETMTTFNFKQ